MNNNTLAIYPSSRVALVTGINGISGHAIVEHLIRTPRHEWSEIIVTSRKPPGNFWVDPRVRFISLDFLESADVLIEKLREICQHVTHAFFTSYIHSSDFVDTEDSNCALFRNFLEAIDTVCPNLQRVSLQTGGKHYGFQFRQLNTPCYEELPRYDGPGSESIFYFQQEDDLFEFQKRRNTWHYNVIRPFGIIGYTPQFSGMNEALPIAQYFLICRELRETPKWPGNYNGYHQVEGQCYAPSVADLHIWAATQDHCKDEAFNHGNGDATPWRFLWTHLGQYFGLSMDGVRAPENDGRAQINLGEWAEDKFPVWERLVKEHGGSVDSFQIHAFKTLDWLLSPPVPGAAFLTSIQKARKFGWSRIDDTPEAWIATIRSYENAGVLPYTQTR